MTRFSLRPSGDVQAYTSAISAAGFATAAGESRWSEARAIAAEATKKTDAMSAAVTWRVFQWDAVAGVSKLRSSKESFSAFRESISYVKNFIFNTSVSPVHRCHSIGRGT